uniref:CAAX prenyl protease 2/Lysostaphin resistance protein A-like domain-containing protein n=1 Tax=Chromera velia CCMP2878 TaxID=1169474 RepID=A0A0G4GWZ2_9ALVE|eukprot:Cvel_23728.t1-p1 / transcript=Cvel_23728.t1 / gene=Cvel_23728 / organism=Chromera_velia_CCMP2878 / gene_product=hypothetical protein / transcript_product=hypothetical protein / location=Cvel_scaffold2480:10921-12682(-) / protein_length=472 / sequence_SO=supercontig / SO=protein_coding / is_pseudo=false
MSLWPVVSVATLWLQLISSSIHLLGDCEYSGLFTCLSWVSFVLNIAGCVSVFVDEKERGADEGDFPAVFWLCIASSHMAFRSLLHLGIWHGIISSFWCLVPIGLILLCLLGVVGPSFVIREVSQMVSPQNLLTGWVPVFLLVSSFLTAAALVAWSLSKRGNHGAIQPFLGPPLTSHWSAPAVFSVGNAILEEADFRAVIFWALLKSEQLVSPLLTEAEGATVPGLSLQTYRVAALAIQALVFAAFHYQGGFPNGKMGVLMVFVWAVVLGLFVWTTGALVAPLLVHIVADSTIAFLIVRAEKRGGQGEMSSSVSEDQQGYATSEEGSLYGREREGAGESVSSSSSTASEEAEGLGRGGEGDGDGETTAVPSPRNSFPSLHATAPSSRVSSSSFSNLKAKKDSFSFSSSLETSLRSRTPPNAMMMSQRNGKPPHPQHGNQMSHQIEGGGGRGSSGEFTFFRERHHSAQQKGKAA